MDPQPREFLMWYAFYTIYMMDHFSSQFKNELQKNLEEVRSFQENLSRNFQPNVTTIFVKKKVKEKRLENRNSALNHETFFNVV